MDRPKVGVGVFIKKDGKYLVGKRKNAHGAGCWSLPGGHLEGGESFESCCERETLEETGITIFNIKPLTFTNDIFSEVNKHYVTLFFKAEYLSGEVQLMEPDKCEGWEWLALNDIPKPMFLPLENLIKQGIVK